ncbi:MAG: ROK family protein [Chitinophagaceae bacterium]
MEQKILCIDIGGSHIKGAIVNEEGTLQTDYIKFDTPAPATPDKVMVVIQQLANASPGYEKISVGFPGYVKDGVVMTAPNLGTDAWHNMNLCEEVSKLLGKPAQVVNDADMQGLGIASGKGFEIVATIGTGFGTAFLYNGKLLPHLELAHHPISKGRDYDQYIGQLALDECGKEKWNKRMMKVLAVLKTVFNYDHLYLGGGNASKLKFPLDDNISIVSNIEGIKGGARLWKDE